MKKKIAVILSGCGFLDGAEIQESVCTLLAIDELGAQYQVFSIDKPQSKVVNHLTKEEASESRNILVESARISRGDILDISKFDTNNFDGIVLPGGFGAATNLCNYAQIGSEYEIDKDIEQAISSAHKAKLPICALCIAPVLIAKVIPGVKLTIGDSKQVASDLEKNSATHQNTKIGEVVIDEKNKVITTPCYMFDARISEIYASTKLAISHLLKMTN